PVPRHAGPRPVRPLKCKQPGARAFGGDSRALGRDHARGRTDHVAHRLPADRWVRIKQPVYDRSVWLGSLPFRWIGSHVLGPPRLGRQTPSAAWRKGEAAAADSVSFKSEKPTRRRPAMLRGSPYSLRSRKKARTYPSASVTSKPHSPRSMNDNSFTNDAPRWRNSSTSVSGSKV